MDITSLHEDQQANEQGLTPLPDIPPLELPVATYQVSRLLSVTEFLATFSEVLELKTKPTAGTIMCIKLFVISAILCNISRLTLL